MKAYYNPVKVIQSDNWYQDLKAMQTEMDIVYPLIVTSNGTRNRLGLDSFFDAGSIYSDTIPNPTFVSCQQAIGFSQKGKFDGVIALGGGSVMDTAKVVMAHLGTGIIEVEKLVVFAKSFPRRVPAIFIPTTHGTGSEVTKWGTVWNMIEKKKYSISHDDLYPDIAILDAHLTLSLPLDQSIIATLDALSHSFEAIWNKNANEKSTEYAIQAIVLILQNVNDLKRNPDSIAVRRSLVRASNLAGLTFSNTKTAAAHSISYPLTMLYGVPHGIACSMPLIPLLSKNYKLISGNIGKILNLLSLTSVEDLLALISKIPGSIIKFNLNDWGVGQIDLDVIADKSFTKERMANNILPLNRNDVIEILEGIYK